MITSVTRETTVHVTVENKYFDDIVSGLGCWSGGLNSASTDYANIEEAADDTNANEVCRRFANKLIPKMPAGCENCDVVINKEKPT